AGAWACMGRVLEAWAAILTQWCANVGVRKCAWHTGEGAGGREVGSGRASVGNSPGRLFST
ncbi:unnamed protein product, partial [Citrullus colocynthis]